MVTFGLPVNVPSAVMGRLCALAAVSINTTMIVGVDAQPVTPGRSGHVHAGAPSGWPGWIR
jgi:hypothetical protein